MKKLIIALLAIASIAASCNNTQNTINPTPPPPPPPTTSLQTYTYAPYNFEFKYPSEFTFTQPNYGNLEEKITQLELPKSVYPNTNFGDAGFTVSATVAASQAQCLSMNKPENLVNFDKTQTINGVVYYYGNGSGVGAGNLYESRVYRTFRNNLCLELTETVHTSNIGNFPPGTVTEVDKNAVWKKLDDVLMTFKFLS